MKSKQPRIVWQSDVNWQNLKDFIIFLGAKNTVKPVSEVDEENLDLSGSLLHSGDNGSINFSISAIAGPFARKDLEEVDNEAVSLPDGVAGPGC